MGSNGSGKTSLLNIICGSIPIEGGDVLVDGTSGDPAYPLSSRTEGNRLVRLAGDEKLIGQWITARITGSNTWALYGEPAE